MSRALINLKGKDFFDPNRIADTIRQYQKDKKNIANEKHDVFKEILDNQGQIKRAEARVIELELQKLALEKEESEVEGAIKLLNGVYNSTKDTEQEV